MHGDRFDAFARVLTAGASRRRLLKTLPGLAMGSVLPWSTLPKALDAGNEPVAQGGACPAGQPCNGAADCATGDVCVDGFCRSTVGTVGGQNTGAGATAAPTQAAAGTGGQTGAEPTARAITTPEAAQARTAVAAEVSPTIPLVAQIHTGVCGSLEASAAFPLVDIGGGAGATPVASGQAVGAASAIPARYSTTVVDTKLADLLSSPFAIDVRLTGDDPATSVACGDIGGLGEGQRPAGELAIGLGTRGESGYDGIAWLREQGDRVVVTTFVAPNLSGATGSAFAVDAAAAVQPTEQPAPTFAAGDAVVVTDDVNLRAAPSADASVVTLLPKGQQLTVTAKAVNGWVPVRDPATGRPGYVDADYLAAAG
jgi:hypothetical protein